jgi:CRISPR-associated exonuclease Cas4
VEASTNEIRKMFSAEALPPPVNDNRCRHCSLQESCMPRALGEKARAAELLRSLFEAS